MLDFPSEALKVRIVILHCNRPFPSCCEPHDKSEAKCKTFHMKIRFCLHMNEN